MQYQERCRNGRNNMSKSVITVKEALRRKQVLEDNIKQLLEDYTDVTGVRVKSLSIDERMTLGGTVCITGVKAEVTL